MTERPSGPVEVRPNTLQGQSVPNTFRSDTADGAAPLQYLNKGGGNMAPPNRRSMPMFPVRAVVILAVILIFLALRLFSGTP